MVSEKWIKNCFPTAKQPVSASQNEGFVLKIHFQCPENR